VTDRSSSNDNTQPKENLFQIMDGIIYHLNRTKKMFIIMILSIMIIPPISFIITFAIFGPPFPVDRSTIPHERFGAHGFGLGFATARAVPFIISLIWLGIGIRQWFVLSKWTKKYKQYRELQKKIDEKLDFDQDIK
jgi:Na+-driven multidrug efflux pump